MVSFSDGILMISQIHREAPNFIYNSGFYMSINVYPNVGKGLGIQVIKKHLKVFERKLLKHKDTSVAVKLHCI